MTERPNRPNEDPSSSHRRNRGADPLLLAGIDPIIDGKRGKVQLSRLEAPGRAMRMPVEEQPAQAASWTPKEKTTVTSVTRTHAADVVYEEQYSPCFLWTLVLAPCFMPFVWKYHVTVTHTELRFGYSAECAAKVIDRSQIATVEVKERIHGLCDWGGYGIRKQLPSWETGYIPKNGPGIRVTVRDDRGKEVAYTFICDEAEKVAKILSGEA